MLSHAVDEELDALRTECSGLRDELRTAVEAVRNTSVSVNTKFEETQKRDTERIDAAVQHVTEQNAKLEVRARTERAAVATSSRTTTARHARYAPRRRSLPAHRRSSERRGHSCRRCRVRTPARWPASKERCAPPTNWQRGWARDWRQLRRGAARCRVSWKERCARWASMVLVYVVE